MIISNRIKDLVKIYHENKLSHAFLFVTNDIKKCNQDIKELIKNISCPHEFKDNCEECNLCLQIEKGFIPNIIEIYPDGQLIKKKQILELKEAFSAKPLYISNNIYIINNAEKLNGSSANTMLKFLEEPEEKILGFFITSNKEAMLPTIKSRCQIINIQYENESILDQLDVSEEEKELFSSIATDYLSQILTNNENGIYLNKKIILPNLTDRTLLNKFFNYLYILVNRAIEGKKDNELKILNELEFAKLLKLQKAIFKVLERIPFNVNIELLIDNFVFEMEEI